MKSLFTRILCALFISGLAQGQIVKGFGAKLGAVNAGQAWNYTINFNFMPDSRWGYDAGIFLEAVNLPCLSFVGEIHYVQKGISARFAVTTSQSPDAIGYTTRRPHADYLSIPILAKVRVETGVITPYLFAGPRVDILLSHNAHGMGSVFDNLKSTGTGASMGIGVEIPLAAGPALLAEFRYSPSLDDAFTGEFLTVRNHSLEILAGIRF